MVSTRFDRDRYHRPMDPLCAGCSNRYWRTTMTATIYRLRIGVIGLALLGTVATNAPAQTVTPEETARSVRSMLERLPCYGVFDYIVFRVDRGTVYLAGYTFEGRLKADAEMAAKRASGVLEVGNKIEVLPTSQNDDRIRWATY